MSRLSLVVAVFLMVLALPAGAVAQDNSGIGEYQENPPGTDPSAPAPPADPSASPTDPATAGDPGVAGVTDTTDAAAGSTDLTESQAAAAGETPSGQLPATGFDETATLAIVGAALLLAGLALRRRVSLG